jgi:uncharacterized repeat protein (TIGR02543 family)
VLIFSGCKKEEFVVTFNPNGGKGALITQKFTEKVSQSLMANSFVNRGHVFTGWNTKPDGTGVAYQDQEMIKASGHLVLYAQWKPVSEKPAVFFNANGGEKEMEPQIFEANVPQALLQNSFECEGYDFINWNTSPNGHGKKFEDQQIITITYDVVLYAQWKIKS